MAKATNKGMHKQTDRKTRGRTAITGGSAAAGSPSPTRPNVERTLKVDATRPIEAGGTKHRGDRRDMSKTYTGTAKHAARGNNPRQDVKTRKR